MRKEPTVAERMLWAELRKLNLNIRRQAPIGRYVADFACHTARVVIEVDGPIHDEPEVRQRDAERTAWLESQGYRVLRISEKVVRNRLYEVVERLAAVLAPPPSPTLPPSRGKGEKRYDIR
jgi:very-short-patch-repair endonuclease